MLTSWLTGSGSNPSSPRTLGRAIRQRRGKCVRIRGGNDVAIQCPPEAEPEQWPRAKIKLLRKWDFSRRKRKRKHDREHLSPPHPLSRP